MQQLAHRPSQQGWPSHGLVSLWDMLKIYAQHYVDLGHQIADASTVLHIAGLHDADHPGRKLTGQEIDDLRRVLTEMRKICSQIPLPHSYDLLRPAVDDLPQTERELDVLLRSVKSELGQRLFLSVADTKASQYENNDLLSPAARTAFPSAANELRSAGNCYALELPTACVFHCMRALEHGLGALATDVGRSWTKEQWNTIIEQIESSIEDQRKSLPRGTPKDERLNFLSQAAKEFFYFKDGWRNYVAHNKITYEDAQAHQTLMHVRDFVQHLALHLSE